MTLNDRGRNKTKLAHHSAAIQIPKQAQLPMSRLIKAARLWLVIAFLALLLGEAAAQVSAPPPQKSETQRHLDGAVQNLTDKLADIEKRVDIVRPSASLLSQLSSEVAPLVVESQALVERLTPRVAAMKARLDQLGPKADKNETPETTKERSDLTQAFADNDGLFKRAKVLAVKAEQDANYIAKRKRALFTTSLFQRSTSILTPSLWLTVVKETPGNVADVTRVFKGWLDAFNQDLSGGKLVAFWAMVLIVLLLYWPATLLAKRFIYRESRVDDPTEWQKAVVACWNAFSVTALMIGTMYGVIFVLSFFAPADARLAPLFAAIQWGVIRLAVAAGLARALVAPNRPQWRLLDVDEATGDQLGRIAIAVALIVSGAKVIEALNDVIGTSMEFSVASRGVGALLVAGALAVALIDLRDDPGPDSEDALQTKSRDLFGAIRGLAWALVVIVVGASLLGFVPLAAFLTEQLARVAGTGALLFLLVKLLDQACAVGFQPNTKLGRNLIYTIGLRRETLDQLPVVLSGAGRLTLTLIAMLIVAAPWGMQSSDLAGNANAIFFGFKIGDVTISLVGIFVAVLSFLLVLALTRAVQRWLENRYLPTTRLDSGLRNSIKTSLGYIGFILALAISAANLGVDFQKLAIVAGALSVGIGFGLQSIVNNFVSGLILLWERAIRVGDLVIVGSDQGYVRKINVRSTEIETFDRASVIVPNSNLVSGVVKNLMRTDRVGRLTIDLTVHASADPEKVREVLLDVVRENENVLTLPSPQVRFIDLTATAMNFSLFCFVGDVESAARTKSDLYFAICNQFRAYKFFDGPAPDPTKIDITGLDRLEAALASVSASQELARSRKAG